jgi:hypothetical protein
MHHGRRPEAPEQPQPVGGRSSLHRVRRLELDPRKLRSAVQNIINMAIQASHFMFSVRSTCRKGSAEYLNKITSRSAASIAEIGFDRLQLGAGLPRPVIRNALIQGPAGGQGTRQPPASKPLPKHAVRLSCRCCSPTMRTMRPARKAGGLFQTQPREMIEEADEGDLVGKNQACYEGRRHRFRLAALLSWSRENITGVIPQTPS